MLNALYSLAAYALSVFLLPSIPTLTLELIMSLYSVQVGATEGLIRLDGCYMHTMRFLFIAVIGVYKGIGSRELAA